MPKEEQPIEAEFHDRMNVLAHILDEYFNGELKGDDRKVAFALLVFKFGSGDDHRANYISNSNREDMMAAMKEFIARTEGRHYENLTGRSGKQ